MKPLFLYFCTISFIFAQVPNQNESSYWQSDVPTLSFQAWSKVELTEALSTEKTNRFNIRSTFALPRPVSITPTNFGKWHEEHSGFSVWQMQIEAANATSLNFGFRYFDLPEQTEFILQNESTIYRFTDADETSSKQLWTPLLFGQRALLQLRVPTAQKNEVRLEMQVVNQGFRDWNADAETTKTLSTTGTCEVDVVCGRNQGFSQIDVYRNQIKAVGMMTINGTDFCTGTLINNVRQDQKPLVLTAHHCISSAQEANSVVMYWNFQNSYCRMPGTVTNTLKGDGSKAVYQIGALYRASWLQTDFSLIELSKPIQPSLGLFMAGWDRRSNIPTSAFSIHHPQGEEKRISFENNILSIETDTRTYPYSDMLFRVNDWDIGYTEEGSSGSGLFSPEGRLVGQLYGGDSVCGSGFDGVGADWYGRISRSWTGGGSPQTRLSDWLDPTNSGTQFMDGKVANMPIATEPTVELPQVFSILSVHPNPFHTFATVQLQSNVTQQVQLRLINTLGQVVQTSFIELPMLMRKNVLIDASELPNGVYFLQLQGASFQDVKQVVVLK